MKKLKIGELVLGEGMPKICIPLTGRSLGELLKEAEMAEELPCQMVEWRADYMLEALKEKNPRQQSQELKRVLGYLRIELDVPIIFTIRTVEEGGRAEIAKQDYFFMNETMAKSGKVDMIDIQAFDRPGIVDEKAIRRFINIAHQNNTKVLLSNHDFQQTPELEEMLARYFVMQELGADLMKLAVMPKTESDVLGLLEVATLMRDTYGEIPFIAISMGELGASTRICGGEFGSVVTFAAGAGSSAPGQINAAALHEFLVQYY